MRRPARRAAAPAARPAAPDPTGPLLYTAQDVARFCEVDLKTIHHWADAGKVPHYRTEGRHLRFRRNDVVRFLRAHGYPLHDELTCVRPTVFLAGDARWGASAGEIAKKLAARFSVRRFDHALAAIAHLVAGEPDAVVVSLDDPTWSGRPAIAALKSQSATSWPLLVVITPKEAEPPPLADVVIATGEVPRLPGLLAKALFVD